MCEHSTTRERGADLARFQLSCMLSQQQSIRHKTSLDETLFSVLQPTHLSISIAATQWKCAQALVTFQWISLECAGRGGGVAARRQRSRRVLQDALRLHRRANITCIILAIIRIVFVLFELLLLLQKILRLHGIVIIQSLIVSRLDKGNLINMTLVANSNTLWWR